MKDYLCVFFSNIKKRENLKNFIKEKRRCKKIQRLSPRCKKKKGKVRKQQPKQGYLINTASFKTPSPLVC